MFRLLRRLGKMSPTSSKAPEDPRPPPKHKHACSLCARRKVKCDKGDPCSNCLKGKAQCLYEAPVPPLPRKRAADEDLLTRLAQYEDLMRQHNIDFTHHANVWIPSGLEVKPEGFVSSVSTESVPYSRANAPGRTTRHLER